MTANWTPDTEGVFAGLNDRTYHAAPGFSHSSSKRMKTPAHYQAFLKEKRDPSPAMVIGTITHALILEPLKDIPFIVAPEGLDGRTAAGKAWKAEQVAKGREVISAEDYASAQSAAESVLSHPTCKQMFEAEGTSELSVFKRFELGGSVMRKARIDWTPRAGSNALVDIKTTRDASPDAFGKELFEYGYHTGAAWYLDIWNDANPNDKRDCFVFVAVEKDAPFAVAVYNISPEAIQLGRRKNIERIQTYIECSQSGVWPSYPTDITAIDLPAWAYGKRKSNRFNF
ncbi:MAG: PD-(D/E)XK nuclease-like domain-containing protein [Verrucomicrobia bacterium]|nr:PD-(D/E)XK nuclease-like domain-containing protein [Verrucomicrobiota bacterium]